MNRAEFLETAKPILFNTEMVKAILKGKKTVTRRIIKIPKRGYFEHEPPRIIPKYRVGDILYVKETFWKGDLLDENENIIESEVILYRADEPNIPSWGTEEYLNYKWSPSIHMPKSIVRIFLKVTDVKVEKLQDMTIEHIDKEGFSRGHAIDETWYDRGREDFMELWNSTIKKQDIDKYGWEANPWVWVIEFERLTLS